MKNHLSCNIAKGIISPIVECMFDFDISSTCPSKESTFALKREKKWFEGINVNHFLQPHFLGIGKSIKIVQAFLWSIRHMITYIE